MNNTPDIPLNSPVWQVVARRENALQKIHNVWLRENVVEGHKLTKEECENLLVSQEESLSRTSMLPSEIKRMAAEIVSGIEKGNTTCSDLNAVRINELRKVTISTKSVEAEAIDFFDGVKVGHFQFVGMRNAIETDAKLNYSWIGAISTNKNFALDRSASFGLDILLLSMPIAESFPPASSEWIVNNDAFVITTKKSDETALRLTLSTKTGCPLTIETLNPKNQKVSYIHCVTQTKVVNGFELPSEIISHFVPSGSETHYQFKYQLKSCKMNGDVDDREALLPAGTQVSDYRLGAENAVGYSITDGKLFTDAQIRTLMASS